MTISTIMLVALGFLVATLLAVLIAPAYRNRTARLTADALRRSLPLTESEIRADRDRLRAEHAIRIHNLETQLERVTLGAARQKIEVNRRDARISELEGVAETQKAQLEELENAKRVLEQTIADRLPKIEGRLSEARKLLRQRDDEVTTLAETAQRQARAITEATQINSQQGAELEQLRTALSTRAVRNQDALADNRFDGEVALRTEIEALRAKSRDQASLIDRLQAVIANPASGADPGVVAAVSGALGASTKASLEASAAEFARLHAEFSELKSAYALARAKVEMAEAQSAGARSNEAELGKLKAEKQDIDAEVARLKAALATYEGDGAATERGSRETPLAMKAKISALEAQGKEQTSIIESLRAENSGLNERLARQAAHYLDEMKRLGAGTRQTSSPGGSQSAARPEPKRASLSDRIQDPRVVRLQTGDKSTDKPASADTGEQARMFNLSDAKAPDKSSAATAAPAKPQPSLAAMGGATGGADEGSPGTNGDSVIGSKPRRQRLLDRITSIEKSGD